MSTSNEELYLLAAKAIKEDAFIIGEENFSLPTIDEFYQDEVNATYLKSITDAVDNSNDLKQVHYLEAPYTQELGYDKNANVFIVKAEPQFKNTKNKYYEELNIDDGDTIYFNYKTIQDGNSPISVAGREYANTREYIKLVTGLDDKKEDSTFGLRFLGVGAPEIPHYMLVKESQITKVYNLKPNEFSNYMYDKTIKRDPNVKYQFASLGDNTMLFEIINNSYNITKYTEDGEKCIKVVSSDSSNPLEENIHIAALKAKKLVSDLLKNAIDMRIIIDGNAITSTSVYDNDRPDVSDILNYIMYYMKGYETKYGGFNSFGQDAYKRFLGVIYVKNSQQQWINVSKYILAHVPEVEVNPSIKDKPNDDALYQYAAGVFKLWTYNFKNIQIADSLNSLTQNNLNDTFQIQEAIMGQSFLDLKDHTVLIGDNLFMVPPTSIKILSKSENERINLLRAKGSMTKTHPKVNRLIEMTLYFNGDYGINGVPYVTTLNGKQKTYHMNGLRSLLAMFKFTPFLPITNKYINETLNIEAVTLYNIQVGTMENYPSCIAATLTMQEFDYRVFMPELPVPDAMTNSNIFPNIFASTIHYPLMRYYYQRAISRGNELRKIKEVNSQEYIEKTIGDKTALQPMIFGESYIDFYLVNKDHLQQLLNIKQELARKPAKQTYTLTDNMKNLATKIGQKFKLITETYAKDIQKEIDYINNNNEYFSVIRPYTEGLIKILNKVSDYGTTLNPIMEVSDDNYGGCEFLLDISNNLTSFEMNTFVEIYQKSLNTEDVIFENGKLKLTLKAKADKPNTDKRIGKFSIDTSNADYLFMEACSLGDMTSLSIMQEYLEETKQSIDLDESTSLKFDKFYIGDVKIKSLSAIYGNSLTGLSLQMSDGQAPQYAGGQDTVLEVILETTDEIAVNMINLLHKLSAQYMRDYRAVLSAWPLRIDSEISRLFGVHEVTIDSIETNTVPGQPGLFTIGMRLVSVDRTVKNREALKKINDFANSGKVSEDTETSFQTKDFFDIKNVLSKVELYPDLELPTLAELEEAGFKFIKYVNGSTRAYPDPDFYFYYGHVLGHEIFRDSVINYLNTNKEKLLSFSLTDNSGGEIKISPKEDIAYTVTDKNEKTKEIEDEIKRINNIIANMPKDKNRAINVIANEQEYSDIVQTISNIAPTHQWQISEEIIFNFRDKKTETILNTDNNLSSSLKEIINNLNQIIINELNTSPTKEWEEYNHSQQDSLILKSIEDPKKHSKYIEDKINSFVIYATQKGSPLKEILNILLKDSSKHGSVVKKIKSMLFAAAATASGKTIHNLDKNTYDWEPRAFLTSYSVASDRYEKNKYYNSSVILDNGRPVPFVKIRKTGQVNKIDFAKTRQDALDYGYSYGCMGIRAYTKEEIEAILKRKVNVDLPCYFLEEYLRDESVSREVLIKRIEVYKESIMSDPIYTLKAFFRNMLFWMKEMLNDEIFINLYDILNNEALSVASTKLASNSYVPNYAMNSPYPTQDLNPTEEDKENKKLVQTYAEIISSQMIPNILGKLFVPVVLTLCDGDDNLYNLIASKDNAALNNYTLSAKENFYNYMDENSAPTIFKKFILALIGTNVISEIENVGGVVNSIKSIESNLMLEHAYIKAADDPMQYIQHSFYDMIVNDKRGRMARAFPTYYMVFVDEGREIGLWKLHDNFYSMSAIGEIQVVKSRKIAADTAKITMSNVFKTYTTEDEDIKVAEKADWRDFFSSIFSPRTYYLKEELARLETQSIERARIRPGVRIHIRMGYGGNAATLPIAFNGRVTEVGSGEAIELIAQGDGVEISNPIISKNDAEDIQFEGDMFISRMFEKFFTEGATPKEILSSILTSKGTYLKRKIKEMSNGRFFNDNPYGITHFGEPNYDIIFNQGEVVQNIYEATTNPSWGAKEAGLRGLSSEYGLTKPPKLSTQVFGKSFWDIMHICASTSPDFIAATAPFQFRSTIFHGAPRFYYAYDYERIINEDGTQIIREKRKPFQQYHIYSSYSDIILNNIKASDKDVKTAAIGMYNMTGWLGKEKTKKVGPLFVDSDIYPENQKTMTVDTQLLAKGSAIGDIIPFINWINNEIGDVENGGGYELAWRMTANALKNSMKEMYLGELIVLGDPTIKPHDKVWINDTYEAMNGAFEVEAVVHNFNALEGFTTSVYPDCISVVDDRHEIISQSIVGDLAANALVAYVSTVSLSLMFAKNTRPLIYAVNTGLKKSKVALENIIGNIDPVINMDKFLENKYVNNAVKSFVKASGYGSHGFTVNTLLDRMKDLQEFEIKTKSINSLKDMINFIDEIEYLENFTNVSDELEVIKKAVESNADNSHIDKLRELRDVIKSYGYNSKNNLKNYLSHIDLNMEDVAFIKEELEKLNIQSTKYTKVINALNNVDGKDSTKLLKSIKEGLSVLGENTNIKSEGYQNIINKLNNGLKYGGDDIANIISDTSKLTAKKGALETALKYQVAFKGALATVVIPMLIEMAVTWAITTMAYENIERWMANLQVLQIYPLKKDGLPYIAGLNGHRGIVVGSSTYNDPGFIEGILVDLFEDKKGTSGWIYNTVRDFLVTDNMKEIVEGYKRDTAGVSTSISNNRESFIQDLLRTRALEEMNLQNSYYASLLIPRINQNTFYTNSVINDAGREFFKNNGVISVSNLNTNQNINQKMIALPYYKELVKLKEEKKFILLHELDHSSTSRTNPVKAFKINNSIVNVNIIEDNSGGIDIPFLAPLAVDLLMEIINTLKITLENTSVMYGDTSGLQKHPVILKSALRVNKNGSETLSCAGYQFTIQVKNYNELEKIISTIQLNELNVLNSLDSKAENTFNYKMLSSDTVKIVVFPAK